jgi:hypothetical protein
MREAVTKTGLVGPQSRENNFRRQQPIAISAAIIISAVTVLVCAGLIVAPLWTALVQDWQVEAISDPCGATDATDREDCFQKLRLGASRHPAKGANAPIRLHGPE